MKKVVVISLILMVAVGVLFAQKAIKPASNPKMHPMRQPGEPMHSFMEEMKLSEAQMTKFAEHRATFERQKNTLEAEVKNLKLDLITAMKAENIKSVKEFNKQISDKELQLKNARVDMLANHLKELSKDQKAIMMKHLPMMMGGGREHQKRMDSRMQDKGMHRRTPGMGERKHDCDDCGDCSGERQHKNRK